MALNKGSINSRAVNNPTSFSSSTGSISIAIEQAVGSLGTTSISIEQRVGVLSTDNTLVSIEQEVQFKSISTVTTWASIEQVVKSLGSISTNVEQTVIAVSDPTSFYGRNGYEPMIYLDGVKVPTDELHGDIDCIFMEEKAPQLSFSIIPPTGAQDIRKYVGNDVIYNVMKDEGGATPVITRVFTGKVNTPTINILEQKLSFKCSVDIEQQAEALSRHYLDGLGFYNNKMFSLPETQLEEFKDRVSTVPELINVNPYGEVDTKSISTATSTKTYGDNDVRRRSLNFLLGSRQQYINKVEIRMNYSYQRLHHFERNYVQQGTGTFCEALSGNIITRELVESAVAGSRGVLKAAISYTDVWAAGLYYCGGLSATPHAWGGGITCTSQLVPSLNEKGEQITIDGVQQKEVVRTCTDVSHLLCNGASWTMAERFSQNVKNEHTITIEAPQSITQNGEKLKTRNHIIRDSFKSEGWEDYDSYNDPIPSGSVINQVGQSYYIEASVDYNDYVEVAFIAMNVAKNEILKSHREDTVEFTRPLTPDLTLKDVVELTATKLATTASVKSYEHTIRVGTGEAYTKVTLVLSQSEGSTTDEALIPPSRIANTPSYDTSTISFGSYFGKDPTSTEEGGYYTDAYVNQVMTSYGTSLRIVSPEVDTSIRSSKELTNTVSFDVEIPDDTLAITLDQWT